MASFVKVTYVDNETVIHAANLNAIQDSTLQNETDIDTLESGKVDKVSGKGLSTNDFTTALLNKLSALPTGSELDAALAEKLDLDDFNEQIEPLEASVEALEETQYDPYIVDTASGDIASFPDGADGIPVKRLLANIEPVQDLHGYEYPWPAGGGKNLFDYTTTTCIDFSNNNGVFTNLVADEKTNMGLSIQQYNGSTFVKVLASGVIATTGRHSYVIDNLESGITKIKIKHNGQSHDLIIDCPWTDTSRMILSFYLDSNQPNVVGGLVISRIMFELASTGTTPSDYMPYSNICPISGWTGANVTRTGKNLASVTYGNQVPSIATGQMVSANGWSTDYIFVDVSKAYVFSKLAGSQAYVLFYDASKNYLGSYSLAANDTSYTLASYASWSSAKYVKLRSDAGSSANPDIQLEIGISATAYEPYTAVTIPISFLSSAGTVYGGTLDVTSGVLTVDRKLYTLGGIASWNKNSGSIFYANMPEDALAEDSYDQICSYYKPANQGTAWHSISNGTFLYWRGLITSGRLAIAIRDDRYTTTEAFKTSIADATATYKLATPVEYTLTPTQVTTLLGTNNVWFDTGDTACEYRADTKKYITKVIAAALNA